MSRQKHWMGTAVLGLAGLLAACGAPSAAAPHPPSALSAKAVHPLKNSTAPIKASTTITARVLPAKRATAYLPETIDAVSTSLVYSLVNTGAPANGVLHLGVSENGGKTWTLRGSIPTPGAALDFVNSVDGYAWSASTLWSTQNGGRNWSEINGSGLTNVTFLTPATGMAIVRGDVAETRDGGTAWPIVLHIPGQTFESVSMVNSHVAFASAMSSSKASLYRTTDGGARWAKIASGVHSGPWAAPFAAYLKDDYHNALPFNPSLLSFNQGGQVTFTSVNDGWVQLFDGGALSTLILHTTDGGLKWSYAWGNTGCASGCNSDGGGLYPAAYQGANNVWRYDYNRIDVSTNGGVSWTRSQPLPVFATELNYDAIETSFASPTVGWTSNQAGIFKTTDGGRSWHRQWPIGPQQVAQAAFAGDGQGWLTTQSASGNLWVTTNGGLAWKEEPKNLNQISAMFLWGGGHGMISLGPTMNLLTPNNGKSWVKDPLSNTFAGPTNFPVSEQFVSRQIGYVATFAGLWRTVDGGKHWQEMTTLPSEGNFLMSFQSADDGWYLSADPANPYHQLILHETRDGGKSSRTAGTIPNNIPGLFFQSPQNGWLLEGLTGSVVLHTTDAGQHWTRIKIPGITASSITAHGHAVYLVTQNGRLLKSTDDGREWRQMVP